ncbi:LysR substrate-binding domain-containing protein [Kiloniella antarctica]|uniref:LysR substrate-binding domain-containing protein n=1 Tax=Kiloniella antarctica TaxID=1550907 RepID=A0ABW5BHV7_9PROT
MKRDRLPLTALRSFEAAGRHESFTLAAQELFVSQAAISRQVRDLEHQIGNKLFARSHRRVQLTQAGAQLLSVLSTSFDTIDNCLSELSNSTASTVLTLSVEPSFLSGWLLPHLKDFRELYPSIDFAFDSDMRVIDFRISEAQLAIRFGTDPKIWPACESKHLLDIEVLPVIAADHIDPEKPLNTPRDLLRYTLLHEDDRTDWKNWFAAQGITDNNIERGPIYDNAALIFQEILEGHGIGFCDKRFIINQLQSGQLVIPFDAPFYQGSYWLVARNFSKLPKHATTFIDWFLPRVQSF